MEDPEGDVTAPELVITGSNGGVEGHPGVMLAGGDIYIEDFQKKNDSLQPSSGESKLKKNANVCKQCA